MKKRKTLERYAQNLVVPYPSVKNADNTSVLCKDYPALIHKIDRLRDKDVPCSEFRTIVCEITTIELTLATANMKLEEYEIETPICKCVGERISGKKMVFIPIIRAGLGMEEAAKKLFPSSRTGHIGLYRDEESLAPIQYFCKMPNNIEDRQAYILDPMLATGGSANKAIDILKDKGCTDIKLISIIAAPQGIDLLQKNHPDVEIYVGCVDLGLNADGYIVPGLGDAGDRIFGTK